jgi:purine-nucleoside phosphorylase
MTPHNEAKPGDYAEAILLPGDPLRAKWIAETFFEEPVQVNGIRNCLGFTGRYKGKPVSVQATGMGQPSLSIYVHELIDIYGAKVLVRVGTCGGISDKVKLKDIVLAEAATTDSAMDSETFGAFRFAPSADFGLLRDAADRADAAGLSWQAGGIVSTDTFYLPENAYDPLTAHGILAIDMETAALYTLAARFGARALTLCAVSDDLLTGEKMEPADRQSSLVELATLALDVAVRA